MTARTKAEPPPVQPQPATLASFDPRGLPTRTMGVRGEYMDVKWRLVWLRREHPDAAIETEEKGHDPSKWATFRASVSIPGGGSATGHGSETAGDFGDYYEKAETKAIGRALSALGYGTQFLPDDGESLADAPTGDVRQPTPIDGGTKRRLPPPKDDHERETRRFHAVGKSHGWTDEALHLIALSEFPTREDGTPTTSRAQLSATDLAWLSDKIEKKIGRIVDAEGEILPTPEVEFANAIAKADLATLDGLATAMKESGILPKWLVMMGKTRKAALDAARGKVIDAAVGP